MAHRATWNDEGTRQHCPHQLYGWQGPSCCWRPSWWRVGMGTRAIPRSIRVMVERDREPGPTRIASVLPWHAQDPEAHVQERWNCGRADCKEEEIARRGGPIEKFPDPINRFYCQSRQNQKVETEEDCYATTEQEKKSRGPRWSGLVWPAGRASGSVATRANRYLSRQSNSAVHDLPAPDHCQRVGHRLTLAPAQRKQERAEATPQGV